MKRREFIKLAGFAAVAGAAPLKVYAHALHDEEAAWHSMMEPLTGAFVSIALYHRGREEALFMIRDCFDFLRRRIDELSNWDERSDLSRLNDRRTQPITQLPSSLHEILTIGERIRVAARETFAPYSLALSAVWRAARAAGSVPDQIDIREAMSSVQSTVLTLRGTDAVLHGSSGIDLDGIGQGYLADLSCRYLKSRGATFARVDCGGDVALMGDTEWRVEIEDPRSEELLGSVTLHGSCGISTSGDSRKHWSVNGVRYHHLLDPRTGTPGRNNQQATVIAPNCMLADGFAKAGFLLPADAGLKFLSSKGYRAVIVDQAHATHISGSLSFQKRA